MLTGNSTVMKHAAVSLPAGAGVTQWYCAGGSPSTDVEEPTSNASAGADVDDGHSGEVAGEAASGYTVHRHQYPSRATAKYTQLNNTNEAACEKACTADPACLGFTMMDSKPTLCWPYTVAADLVGIEYASWYQKPNTRPIPAPPAPPAPPPGPPPQLKCAAWSETAGWKGVGCDAGGVNCVLEIKVEGSTGDMASLNVLPFVPPVKMKLPADASVTATVGAVVPKTGEIEILLSAKATAMFVVLTTLANGRFSDNAFLLEAGTNTTVVTFIPWGSAAGAPGSPALQKTVALLKSSLRVEHLAQNLA